MIGYGNAVMGAMQRNPGAAQGNMSRPMMAKPNYGERIKQAVSKGVVNVSQAPKMDTRRLAMQRMAGGY